MRLLLTCPWMLLGWLLVGQSAEPEVWEKHVSLGGSFELRSPGPLTEQVDTFDTEIGRLAFHRLYYQSPDAENSDNLVYQVTWVQYPPAVFPSDSVALVEDFFQETMAEAAETVKGELAYSNPIELQGHPGYLWRIHYLDEQAVIKTKAFLRNGLYVAVSTVTYRQKSLNRSSDRFLDSFRFLE